MKTSENITKIAVALLEAQKQIGAVRKGSKNPFFDSKYADLPSVIEAVKGPFNDNLIVFMQSVDVVDGQPVIETRLLHASGEWVASQTPVFCKDSSNPQALGSGVTYSKRYALQSICGLPTADDDGEGAMGRDRKQQSKKTPPKKPPLDVASLQTPKGLSYVKSFPTAQAAIDKAKTSYNVSDKDAAIITEIWESEAGQ